jgi:hypothetical protein
MMLPVALLVSSCEQQVSPLQEGKIRPPTTSAAPPTRQLPATPPDVVPRIADVKLNWRDRQQTFNLILHNRGKKPELVHAIVYGSNEGITPPRRGISPPTAYHWFTLAKKNDGALTADDIEQAWKAEAHATARGGKLRKSWDVKIDPQKTVTVDAAHDLDEKSPHPQWKDKKLTQTGYTEYRIWLFTADGQCFYEQVWPAFGPPPEPKNARAPKTSPDTAKPAEPKLPDPVVVKSVDPRIESLARDELKLATYFLERNRKQDARDKLNHLLKTYPDTESARLARRLLDDIEARSRP